MSRVSSKSQLSSSATGQSNSVNLGEKTQTSVSSGGIGVTREIANIGGVSITGGASVEVSPIRLDISGNVDYDDPTKNSVSVGAGAEVPGGILGVSGGVTINTTTGAIEEVSIGGEIAGIGGNISVADDGWGFGVSLQIPFTSIEINLGFGFPDDKKKPIPKSPTPTLPPNAFNPNKYPLETTCSSTRESFKLYINEVPYSEGLNIELAKLIQDSSNSNAYTLEQQADPYAEDIKRANAKWQNRWRQSPHNYLYTAWKFRSYYLVSTGGIHKPYNPASIGIVKLRYSYEGSILGLAYSGTNTFYDYFYGWTSKHKVEIVDLILPFCPGGTLFQQDQDLLSPSPISIPFPNPPPRKEKMDECCRENLKF